ncbi:MAG: hypothetical protein ACE5JL_00575 [Dehalococcoidia bacterium]
MARKAALSLLRRKATRLAFVVLVSVLPIVFLASSSGPQDNLSRVIGGRGYSLVSWEVQNFFDKWLHQVTSLFDGKSKDERITIVQEYFQLNEEIGSVNHQISRVVSTGEGDLEGLIAQREVLDKERAGLRNEVEEIIEGQISKVLSEEGLSWKLPFGGSDGYLFPPVDFRFDDSPPVLAISPRERIELITTRLLKPGLTLEDIEEIEMGAEEEGGLSAVVTSTGGVATFPSVVSQSASLRHTLRTVSHEWVHHYMIFFPLGRSFWNSADMATINETIADIVGDYIANKVFYTYYSEVMDTSSPSFEEAQSGSLEDTFDFNREMRITRLRVDELLVEGKVEEAEQYMEERRLFLAENGSFLRKLNQAFFAFNGTYAAAPTSVSPIGGQVRQLRAASPSLKDFIERVASISSFSEFLSRVEAE